MSAEFCTGSIEQARTDWMYPIASLAYVDRECAGSTGDRPDSAGPDGSPVLWDCLVFGGDDRPIADQRGPGRRGPGSHPAPNSLRRLCLLYGGLSPEMPGTPQRGPVGIGDLLPRLPAQNHVEPVMTR